VWNIPNPAGWQLPDWNEAALEETPDPLAGEHAYKLVDARIIDNPGSHHIFVEVMTEDNERDHEAKVFFQNADGSVIILEEEKPLDEPMLNKPMIAGDTFKVWVDDASVSDAIVNVHTRYDDHPEDGTTWGHVPYLVQFQRVVGEDAGPGPGETLEEFLRRKTWDELYPSGVNYLPTAAFTIYARERGLAVPTTNEFDVEFDNIGYRVQGFCLGIVYAQIDQWQGTTHVSW